MKALNKDIKTVNKFAIAKYIYQKKAVTKQDIAYNLNMSLPTVFQNTKELENEGIIYQVGQLQSTGGRKATEFSIVPDFRFSIGVDITNNHLTTVLLNFRGEMIDIQRIRFQFHNQIESYLEIAKQIENIKEKNNIETEKILGVGISIAGIVDIHNNLLYTSHILNIGSLDLQKFSQFIPYPLCFANDANSAAFAETHNHSNVDLIYIALNYSIGGAIYFNGKIVNGDNFKAGEIGHMTIIPNGQQCYCGKKGCFDAYCSERFLLKYADNLQIFFELLERKDEKICQIWDEYLEHLAIAINNLRMIFDCDIVIGGTIRNYIEPYMIDLSEKLIKYNPFEHLTSYLKLSQCQKEASAIGVATMHIDQFFNHF